MAITQSRPKLKPTGARYIAYRKKKQHELGKPSTLTKVSKEKKRIVRGLGGNLKFRITSTDVANVLDPKTKKYAKAKIKNVVESEANKHYSRRNIMVKGAVIETDLGKAKITSRPGQDGTVNAVLVSE